MNDAEYLVRKEIIATCLAMEKKGINQGTSGNVSARWLDGILIIPPGLTYDAMAPGAGDETRTRNLGKGEDLICRVAKAGNRRHATSRPTLFQSPPPKFCELSIRTAGFIVLRSLNGASSSAICCGRRATGSRVSATASGGLISFS